MSLKNLLRIFIVITLALASTITATAILLDEITNDVEAAQQRRFTSYSLAQELLRSSEMLTRFARTYVATGEKKYRDYYDMILEIREGKIAKPDDYSPVYWFKVADGLIPPPSRSGNGKSLDEQMQDAGVTVKEFALLRDAHNRSDDLVKTEDQAMDMVEKLTASGDSAWQSNPEHLKAIDLLHDHHYYHAKAIIMDPIGKFLDMLSERSELELQAFNRKSDNLLLLLLISSGLMLISFIGFALMLYKQLMVRGGRLLDSVKAISEGKLETRIRDKATDELGRLSAAIDGMTEKLADALHSTRKELKETQALTEEISEQKEHSEKLLHNMLPVLIADRLKRGESQIAETFPEVTVLFADIVGFTELSTTLPPRQLVNLLNDIFGVFDELADKYHLEKIKTIGDCYMVVGGVPDRSPTHCQQVADFAIEAVKSVQDYSSKNGMVLNIRVGIHTGTVVAGVVGKRKYSYDLWGDVVNTASRLESTSGKNQIQITEAVRVRLNDDYLFEYRGPVELKGKGVIETHFLTGKKLGH